MLLFSLPIGVLGPRVAHAEAFAQVLRARPDAPLSRARRALNVEDPKGALDALKDYAGAAVPYANHLRAHAYWKLGEQKKADAMWEAIKPTACPRARPSPLQERIRLTRANLLSPTDPARAAAQLLALPSDPDRLATAYGWLKPKDKPQAEALQVRLLVEFAGSPAARAMADEMGQDAVRALLKTDAQRLARLNALVSANANDDAAADVEYLLKKVAKTDPKYCEVAFLQGLTSRKRRKYREAKDQLHHARHVCQKVDADFALRAALIEAQVEAILGSFGGVREVVQWMTKNHPQHRFTDDANFLLADVLDRKGRTKAARNEYTRVAAIKGADHANLAEWRLAWADLEANDNKDARIRLIRILRRTESEPDQQRRATYWLGRIEEPLRPTRSVERYEALAARPSFYGWLALDRLRRFRPDAAKGVEKRLEAAATAPSSTDVPAELLEHAAFAEARAYAQAGEADLAAWALERVACDGADTDLTLAIALALDAVGASADAQLRLRARPQLLAAPISAETVDRWRAAYSRPFRAELRNAAEAAKIDELLLTALAREESTFDPDIVSWAGATGLTQLMPATAVGAHDQLFNERLDLQRLTEPGLNARLGAHVLHQGISGLGHPVLGLGAYNGGFGLVKRALSSKDAPFERWIERFTVKETRRYMKRVTESWGIYRLLYDRKQPFIELPKTVARRR